MIDQASKLRSLMGAASPHVEVGDGGVPMVVVTGARGGVGATTVAVNLAAVMADQGERVMLVDGAQQRNEIIATSGSVRSFDYSLCDLLAGKCEIAKAIVPGPAGVRMLLNRWSARTSPDFSRSAQQRLFGELQSLEGSVDLIVVDAGRGLTAWSRRFWSRANLILLVTTPEDAAVLDAYAVVKQGTADAVRLPVRLIVNQAENDFAAESAQRRLAGACERFLSRRLPALPALPRHDAGGYSAAVPRVWEMPNTVFGHAALWLGRAVRELLEDAAGYDVQGARDEALTRTLHYGVRPIALS
jgi:flagellar biosynthesis protein FlhG